MGKHDHEYRNVSQRDPEAQIQALKDGIDKIWMAIEDIQEGRAVLVNYNIQINLKNIENQIKEHTEVKDYKRKKK